MKAYLKIIGVMFTVFLAIFLVVDWLGFSALRDPVPWMDSAGPIAAAFGIALLVSDVILPVPSTLVMIANGSLFGIWAGTLLSLIGCLSAGLLGFGLGRRSGSIVRRLVSQREQDYFNRLIARWGVVAIIVSRPVPIISETVAIVAGTTALSWSSMIFATLAGSLPGAIICAFAGAEATNVVSSALLFGLVALIAVLALLFFYAREKFVARKITL